MNNKGKTMNKQEILNYLKLIESELTDAYNVTPDTSENSDTLYYIDNCKDLVNELATNIEEEQEEPIPHEDLYKEKELKHFADGEGRLKGRN